MQTPERTHVKDTYIYHAGEEVVLSKSEVDHEEWRKIGFGRAPDAIRRYANGEEVWYYLTLVAGMDDEGVYTVVQDGPAQGEKAYA